MVGVTGVEVAGGGVGNEVTGDDMVGDVRVGDDVAEDGVTVEEVTGIGAHAEINRINGTINRRLCGNMRPIIASLAKPDILPEAEAASAHIFLVRFRRTAVRFASASFFAVP